MNSSKPPSSFMQMTSAKTHSPTPEIPHHNRRPNSESPPGKRIKSGKSKKDALRSQSPSRHKNESDDHGKASSPPKTPRCSGQSTESLPKTPQDARQSSESPPKTPKDARQSSKSPPKTRKEPTQRQPTLTHSDIMKNGLKIVDMSGQGMTGIPSSLFTAKDIGELILASNNLRSIPPDVRKLTSLNRLDLSKNGMRCSHPNDYGGLPGEMQALTSLQHLQISECNMPFIPPVVWKMNHLKTLDISRNKINILVPDIGNLTSLNKVNLQQTNISSLPPEIAYCQDLEEILLWGNCIESLPETLPELPNLKVLAINYRSFCGVVDEYMENLLKKGQIKSEHIPTVVFELPMLEVLDLENTKLNNIPEIYNYNLKEFYLCHNFLQVLPISLFKLKHLTHLDVSHNLMNEMPRAIGYLTSLKVLRASNNTFEKIPETIGKLFNLEELDLSENLILSIPKEIQLLYTLKTLIMSSNQLTCLPNEICDLIELETLDLTDNIISQLPMKLYNLSKLTVAHSYRKLRKYGLWLYNNPIEQPPPEIWRTEKPETIFDYLKKLAIIRTKNLQTLKILVLGDTQAGKTCLAKTLAFRKSQMTNGLKDKTRVLSQIPWKTDNNVEMVLNDFGGSPIYHVTTPLFLDSKALILLVFDGSSFTKKHYHKAIGQWIDVLHSNTPGVIVKVVATHSDLMDTDKSETEERKSEYDREGLIKEVSELVQKQVSDYINIVDNELNEVEMELGNIKNASENEHYEAQEAAVKLLTVRQNKLKEISTSHIKVLPDISVVSSSESLEGIRELTDEIEHMAIDISLFPHVQRKIPSSWNKLCVRLKRKRGNYLLWDEVTEVAKHFNIKDTDLEDCIHYLHDIGEILWYFDVTGLSEILFHKPRILVDILSSLYRHDIEDFMSIPMNNIFSSKGNLTEEEFEEARQMFLNQGQICRPLLNCLWFYQNMDLYTLEDMLELLPLLDLCYSVPDPDVPTCRLHSRPLMVIPWYNNDDTSNLELPDLWSEMPESPHKELSVVYRFPFHFPISLFEKMVSSIQDLVMERIDWTDSVYAESENEKVLLVKTKTSVKLFVRGGDFHSIMELATEFIQIFNSMLIRYPGLYWTLIIPMKSPEFLSHVAQSPSIRFASVSAHLSKSYRLEVASSGTRSSKSNVMSSSKSNVMSSSKSNVMSSSKSNVMSSPKSNVLSSSKSNVLSSSKSNVINVMRRSKSNVLSSSKSNVM